MTEEILSKEKLIRELKSLDDEINTFNLSDDERKKERVNSLHKYNDTKDGALNVYALIAELKGKSLGRVLTEYDINFDK